MMTYGSGLRVSEVVKLQRDHIDSERMLVRVEQAKNRKDRYTLLSTSALESLRLYWKVYRPGTWIFYGRSKDAPMAVTTAQMIFRRSKKAAGLTKGKGIHCLRHCFATHLLEQGKEKWLNERSSELLPCSYFHLVFTAPHEPNTLIMGNKRVLLALLFKTAADMLASFAKNQKWRLGGKLGFIAVLHTWNRCLITLADTPTG
jgi:hypothetical protein